MTYPNAYCVKCGGHTETLGKHTVVLQSQARAVTGVCAACATNVYKIVAKAQDFNSEKKYPDAFCVKCQKHTETLNCKTVVLENASRALKGICKACGCDVYRIMSPSQKAAMAALKKLEATVSAKSSAKALPLDAKNSGAKRGLAVAQRAPIMQHAESVHRSQWSDVVAAGTIIVIIMSFFAYAVT